MAEIKHVGQMKGSGAKVVLFIEQFLVTVNQQLLFKIANCTEDHDALMKVIESNARSIRLLNYMKF